MRVCSVNRSRCVVCGGKQNMGGAVRRCGWACVLCGRLYRCALVSCCLSRWPTLTCLGVLLALLIALLDVIADRRCHFHALIATSAHRHLCAHPHCLSPSEARDPRSAQRHPTDSQTQLTHRRLSIDPPLRHFKRRRVRAQGEHEQNGSARTHDLCLVSCRVLSCLS